MEDEFKITKKKYEAEGWNTAGANMLAFAFHIVEKNDRFVLQPRSWGYYVIVVSFLISICYIVSENTLGIDQLQQSIFFSCLIIGQISSNIKSAVNLLLMLDKRRQQRLVNELVDLALQDQVDPEDEEQVYKYLSANCGADSTLKTKILNFLKSTVI